MRKEVGVNIQPHFSCWEFCFLALKDIGLVSDKQLDDLCYIVYKINEKNESEEVEVTLANALFKLPIESYREFSQDSLPTPGDFSLFQKKHRVRHYYASICIDHEGGFIGLEDGECVRKGNFTKYDTLKEDWSWDPEDDLEMFAPEHVYYVPVTEVALNIQNFLETHQNVLGLKEIEPKKTEDEVLQALKETQYEQLVEDINWATSMIILK